MRRIVGTGTLANNLGAKEVMRHKPFVAVIVVEELLTGHVEDLRGTMLCDAVTVLCDAARGTYAPHDEPLKLVLLTIPVLA
jgi:hypothetical protein